MAKVYAPPTYIKPPSYGVNFDFNSYAAANDKYIEELRVFAQRRTGEAPSKNPMVGKVIRFPVADGYAQYMVLSTKPLALMHIESGDAYSIPAAHMRGLNLTEVKKLVKYEEGMAKLFSKKEKA